MPQISMCFQGWLRGVDIKTVFDVHGKSVDVSDRHSQEVVGKLTSGEWSVRLRDHLGQSDAEEIQIHDFSRSCR